MAMAARTANWFLKTFPSWLGAQSSLPNCLQIPPPEQGPILISHQIF